MNLPLISVFYPSVFIVRNVEKTRELTKITLKQNLNVEWLLNHFIFQMLYVSKFECIRRESILNVVH